MVLQMALLYGNRGLNRFLTGYHDRVERMVYN